MGTRPLDLFTWPAEIGWSDLGTPERLEEWLAVRRPAGDTLDILNGAVPTEHVA